MYIAFQHQYVMIVEGGGGGRRGREKKGGLRVRVPFTFGACINPFSTRRRNVQSGTTDACVSSLFASCGIT